MDRRDKLITEKLLINFFLAFGIKMSTKRRADTTKKVMRMGLNKVNVPIVTKESYVYINTSILKFSCFIHYINEAYLKKVPESLNNGYFF